MKSHIYNVTAVEYTNTKPLLYKINEHEVAGLMHLDFQIPSVCASKLINRDTDIGLVPVAVIPEVSDANIISDYCISSTGAVNSVFVYAHKPITEITSLKLDKHSRTSNMLARVLCRKLWQRDVTLINDTDAVADAEVLIGDRTFGLHNKPYRYDLGEAWHMLTGLPFVYAAWVANREIDDHFKRLFDHSQTESLARRKELLQELPPVAGFDLEDYIFNKLEYNLTDEKRKAIQLFLSYIAEVNS